MSEPAQDNTQGKGSFERDQVVKIISSVINKVGEAEEFSREAIHNELKNLQFIIEEARKEIGAAKADQISGKHIPSATDELDAVVAATAEATGTIMDACEVIETKAGEAGGDAGDTIAAEVTKIYEACSFQDITGQRITKVVTTLRTIEEKVNALLDILGDQAPGADEQGEGSKESGGAGDSALLNGPQMPDKAITQDDIDKILAEFD